MNDHFHYLLRLPKLEHLEAITTDEAIFLLNKYKHDARLIAGGTDLLVLLKKRELYLKYLVNLKCIPGLSYIQDNSQFLNIGALTTINELETSPIVRKKCFLLASAAQQLGTPQIRNMGTIGGNLCNASPAADSAPALIGLNARVKLSGTEGERVMNLEDFFIGPRKSALRHSELLTEIQIPISLQYSHGAYLKLPARTAVDIAVAGVAVVLSIDPKSRKINDLKVVLGGVAPTPIRALRAEDTLRGKNLEKQLIDKASKTAAEESSPISDIRGSSNYKREMVKVLTKRAIKIAAEQFNT